VKLTARGKDLLKAALAGTIAATVLDINVVLALCLSLVFAALISEFILARSSTDNIEVRPEKSHVSCFKGEEATARLVLKSKAGRFVSISLSKFVLPKGLKSEMENNDQETFGLRITPKYAGRFSGMSAQFELNDSLRLFKKTVEFAAADFTFDCYPSSILNESRTTRPVTLSIGEREARSQGVDMEFYSVDQYTGATEMKNIFWKKVASMPDERLLLKTRAANIQKSVSIALIRKSERGEDSLGWMDAACEGIAQIGKSILKMGCDVAVMFAVGEQVVTEGASDLGELSEAIMTMSTSGICDPDSASLLLSRADICVTGFKEVQDKTFTSTVARKPTLLIEDPGVTLSKVGELTVIYKPYQDMTRLVSRVAWI